LFAGALAGIPQVVQGLPKAATDLGKVRITDIKTAQVVARYVFNLVKIETDSGLFGIGEAFARQGILEHVHAMKPLLVGQDPLLVETHWNRLMEAGSGIGSAAGSLTSAIAGIESAMWDLAGKILNVPIYVLLGGKYREKLMVYFDTGSPSTPDPAPWVEEARKALSLGYKSIKFDLDWEAADKGWRGKFPTSTGANCGIALSPMRRCSSGCASWKPSERLSETKSISRWIATGNTTRAML
jgi:L-alanine-DL-glutamate epimerase-like enolase superfamily enzyme